MWEHPYLCGRALRPRAARGTWRPWGRRGWRPATRTCSHRTHPSVSCGSCTWWLGTAATSCSQTPATNNMILSGWSTSDEPFTETRTVMGDSGAILITQATEMLSKEESDINFKFLGSPLHPIYRCDQYCSHPLWLMCSIYIITMFTSYAHSATALWTYLFLFGSLYTTFVHAYSPTSVLCKFLCSHSQMCGSLCSTFLHAYSRASTLCGSRWPTLPQAYSPLCGFLCPTLPQTCSQLLHIPTWILTTAWVSMLHTPMSILTHLCIK